MMGTGCHPDGGLQLPNTVLSVAFLISGRVGVVFDRHLRLMKRAAVAVARKLAVLLHRLWVSGEVYEPLHNAMSAPIAAAA